MNSLLKVFGIIILILFSSCENKPSIEELEIIERNNKISSIEDELRHLDSKYSQTKDLIYAEEIIKLYNELLKIVEEKDKVDIYGSLAFYHSYLEDYKASVFLFTKSLNLKKQLGYKGNLILDYFYIGEARLKSGDYMGAKNDLNYYINNTELENKQSKSYNEACFYLGIINLELNNKTEGCKNFRESSDYGNDKAFNFVLEYCN